MNDTEPSKRLFACQLFVLKRLTFFWQKRRRYHFNNLNKSMIFLIGIIQQSLAFNIPDKLL